MDTDQVIAELTNCIENASRWNVSTRVPAPNKMVIWLENGTRYELTITPMPKSTGMGPRGAAR